MKKLIIFTLLCAFSGIDCCGPGEHKVVKEEIQGSQQQSVVYTCPMHSEIRQATSGNCPKCGMPLQEVK